MAEQNTNDMISAYNENITLFGMRKCASFQQRSYCFQAEDRV